MTLRIIKTDIRPIRIEAKSAICLFVKFLVQGNVPCERAQNPLVPIAKVGFCKLKDPNIRTTCKTGTGKLYTILANHASVITS